MKNYHDDPRFQEGLRQMRKHLNSFMPQKPELFELLGTLMKPIDNIRGKPVFWPTDISRYSYFVFTGYFIVYTLNAQGDKQVLRIYGPNSIVSLKSFHEQTTSGLYGWASYDTYLLAVNFEQMGTVYEQFPETHTLAKLILADWDKKEMERLVMLNQEVLPLLEQFYNMDNNFLRRRKIISDIDLASYLLISESALRAARTLLLKTGKIKRPIPNTSEIF